MKKKNLLLTVVATFLFSTAMLAQVPNYVPSNGLVGWWPFNGNANDESGNGNNGNVFGATLTSDRFGMPFHAFNFNGTSDYILVNNSNSLNITGSEITISYWINYENAISTIDLYKGISKGGYDVGNGYELIFANNSTNVNGNCQVNGAQGGFYCGDINLYRLNWTQITATVSNGIGTIYYNGILQSTNSSGNGINNFIATTASLYFGKRNPLNMYAGFVEGRMDDIGIWNRALTQQEVTNLFTGTNVGVNEIAKSNLFTVYPNPANEQIIIKADASLLGANYTIYDNVARLVLTGKLQDINTQIELGNLTEGVYVFKLGEGKEQSFKIVKH
jgi:Concanavalin A-like lectin/glucanases superfamily/Secretion system C-terminal sorting domain